MLPHFTVPIWIVSTPACRSSAHTKLAWTSCATENLQTKWDTNRARSRLIVVTLSCDAFHFSLVCSFLLLAVLEVSLPNSQWWEATSSSAIPEDNSYYAGFTRYWFVVLDGSWCKFDRGSQTVCDFGIAFYRLFQVILRLVILRLREIFQPLFTTVFIRKKIA